MVKLGKLPPRHDTRTLRFARYAAPDMPAPPPMVEWDTEARDFGMLLNDQLGDCTCATIGHMRKVFNAANGRQLRVVDDAILEAYKAVGGYVPGRLETDNGAYAIDALNYWRNVGVGGDKILGYAAVDLKNRTHFMQGIAWFGGVYLGVALPRTAESQSDWHVAASGMRGDPAPGSWGGHAMSAHAYQVDVGLRGITWGGRQPMSWAWLDAYCDEAYVVVSEEWADADGAPPGFDKDRLLRDILAVS